MDGSDFDFNIQSTTVDSHVQLLSSLWLFQSGGDIIELDAWLPEDVIEQAIELNKNPALIKRQRVEKDNQTGRGNASTKAGSENGPKGGFEYNFVPEGWGLPSNATTPSCLMYDCGDYLFPHRDKWKSLKSDGRILGDSLRLMNFANGNNHNEFTFIHDGKVVTLEPRRWYAVNTRKIHSGVSFMDNVWHFAADIHLNSMGPAEYGRTQQENLEISTNWLLKVLPFAQSPADTKGVSCTRN